MSNDLATSRRAVVDAFLEQNRQRLAAAGGRGRLIFALDATLSRQPTWDIVCGLQADMFRQAAAIGGLDMQLVYYRGMSECRALRWLADGRSLAEVMGKISCRGGQTQIGKVLAQARRESERQKVQALVFVGDAMEERVDDLCAIAGELGSRGVQIFLFQEGSDPAASSAFAEIARLGNGAHCRFGPGSAHELAELLRAVAVYAAAGRERLLATKTAAAAKLLAQLPPR
jgi:hypothetical protein